MDNPEKFDIISNIKHIKHIKKLGNTRTYLKQANQNKSKKQINSKKKKELKKEIIKEERNMANIHQSITELVGHTPLVELKNYEKSLGLKAHLLGKLEYFNPSGSVKDRAALNMILEAEKDGRLKPGGKILDSTNYNRDRYSSLCQC